MKLKKALISLICISFIAFGASACAKKGSKKRVKGDENWVDYVNDGSVKLGLDYVGHDFYTDGIGQFTLKTAIDGDTAHFTPAWSGADKSNIMKARFYGIDTPESTGKVQEWGKEASEFTKTQLLEANEHGTIVVSSAQNSYGAPEPDSTGSRYVSLVWINLTEKNAPMDKLILLNLWIVQEGLSWVKNVQSMPQYSDTFYKAEDQAKLYELCLHSKDPAPYFNYGDYEDVSLMDIKQEIQAGLDEEGHANKYNNAKIRIQGTVAGYSSNILYLQDYVLYDKDDPSKGGEHCGINIFVGMSAIPSKYTVLNTFIQVCGLAQDTENYGFQVTDTQGRFPVGSPTSENDAKIIYTPEQNVNTEHNLTTLEYTKSELNAVADAKGPYNLECLNCRVSITENLKVKTCFISTSSKQEITLTFYDASFSCYIPFNYKGDPSSTDRWITEDKFVDHTFTLKGTYVLHRTQSGNNKFQIVPNLSPDLVFIS